jgi:NADPH-dependent curcumin reductase CurA
VVLSRYGWREAFVAAPKELRAVDKSIQPLSVHLGTLGMTGMTAWAGLTLVDVKAGDVLLAVSSTPVTDANSPASASRSS